MRRITEQFEQLAGKTISRIGYGGQFMWVVFDDESYVFLDAHSFVMNYDSTIHGQWRVDIGLITQEQYDEEVRRNRERSIAEIEDGEIKELSRLVKKYVPEIEFTRSSKDTEKGS